MAGMSPALFRATKLSLRLRFMPEKKTTSFSTLQTGHKKTNKNMGNSESAESAEIERQAKMARKRQEKKEERVKVKGRDNIAREIIEEFLSRYLHLCSEDYEITDSPLQPAVDLEYGIRTNVSVVFTEHVKSGEYGLLIRDRYFLYNAPENSTYKLWMMVINNGLNLFIGSRRVDPEKCLYAYRSNVYEEKEVPVEAYAYAELRHVYETAGLGKIGCFFISTKFSTTICLKPKYRRMGMG